MFTCTRTLAALALLAGTAAAHAQLVGTYYGTTSEGGTAQVTVGYDGNGQLAVTGDSFGWMMNCTSGDQKGTAWGVGLDIPLTGRTATNVFAVDFLYEKIAMRFSLDGQTVEGTFVGSEPMYIDVNSSKKVENCTSNKLTFTATLGMDAQSVPRAAAFANLKVKHID